MLKRKIYERLKYWKQNSFGETALLIEGARRVGKSFIVSEFAKNEYKSHIIIDFGNVSKEIKDLFQFESTNLDLFFVKLSVYYSTKLFKRESLIVFDEIQQFPLARQLIKYLVQDKRYDYIETGSLIGLKKNVKDIIIPSEEERIEMFPLDFEEFLWALGDEVTFPLIKTSFNTKNPLGPLVHRKIINTFREYMLVGGMPQSVLAYIPNKDFQAADVVKRRILNLYRNDISKFSDKDEDKVFSIFNGIPGQLSKKEKKYTLSSINQNARYTTYKDSFLWLNEALIINSCFNSTDPNIGLALSLDNKTQKCYMGDTGLLVSEILMDNSNTENELYRSILFGKTSINEGIIMENIVAQMLRSSGHKLYFYSRSDAINRENHMEIDFLVKVKKKIVPIEVKSSHYQTHSSIDKFRKKFSTSLGNPIILYDKDVMIKDGIVHLPIYMATLL